MRVQSLREGARQELETMSDEQLQELVDYMRFLKVRHVTRAAREQAFSGALQQARAIAAKEGITEQDIENEVRTVRAIRR